MSRGTQPTCACTAALLITIQGSGGEGAAAPEASHPLLLPPPPKQKTSTEYISMLSKGKFLAKQSENVPLKSLMHKPTLCLSILQTHQSNTRCNMLSSNKPSRICQDSLKQD